MLGFIGGLGPTEIIVILVLLLLLFGAKRLPELARGLGQGIREFRKSVKEISHDVTDSESGPDSRPGPSTKSSG
jgi:sec-independent protein translocase protein TatA